VLEQFQREEDARVARRIAAITAERDAALEAAAAAREAAAAAEAAHATRAAALESGRDTAVAEAAERRKECLKLRSALQQSIARLERAGGEGDSEVCGRVF
jgi:hypothetical protein